MSLGLIIALIVADVIVGVEFGVYPAIVIGVVVSMPIYVWSRCQRYRVFSTIGAGKLDYVEFQTVFSGCTFQIHIGMDVSGVHADEILDSYGSKTFWQATIRSLPDTEGSAREISRRLEYELYEIVTSFNDRVVEGLAGSRLDAVIVVNPL
jgi:hypothetical protein